MTDGTTHTYSNGSIIDELANGLSSMEKLSDGDGREQGTLTFEEQLADESVKDTTRTNVEFKQGVLLSSTNRHFCLGLWTAFCRFDQTAKTERDKYSIVSELMHYLQSNSFMEKIQFFKLTKSHTSQLPVEITYREAE